MSSLVEEGHHAGDERTHELQCFTDLVRALATMLSVGVKINQRCLSPRLSNRHHVQPPRSVLWDRLVSGGQFITQVFTVGVGVDW